MDSSTSHNWKLLESVLVRGLRDEGGPRQGAETRSAGSIPLSSTLLVPEQDYNDRRSERPRPPTCPPQGPCVC